MSGGVQTLSLHLVPDMPDAAMLLPWLRQIDANRWYTNYGPLVQAFEAGFLSVVRPLPAGRLPALTTLATGYHALELGLRALRLAPGGAVLMPAMTFPACPLAARHAGLEPLFADVDPVNWQLTPAIAAACAARHKIAAVMPVAVYGVPVDAAGWDAFTAETGIPVLIDAAAAVETQVIPRHCLVAHSLHATKPFGVGEGGVLIGGDSGLIARVRQLSNFGTVERIAQDWGTNAKLSEYHAAVGLAQLARWDAIKAARRALFHDYERAFAGLPVRMQGGAGAAVTSLLMLDVRPRTARAVMDGLRARRIAAHQTYLPALYTHPAFAGVTRLAADGSAAAVCGVIAGLERHLVGVPFHPFVRGEDLARLAEALDALLA